MYKSSCNGTNQKLFCFYYKIGQESRKDTDGGTTQQQAAFLCVHNAGANHQEWLRFINHPAMAPIKNSSVFIHVDIPGQEANAEVLDLGKDPAGNDKKFPTMQVSAITAQILSMSIYKLYS